MMSNIKIYFKKNNIISLKRSELFGLTDFLSNCGGLLGLFMGFSILSIIELLYYLSLRWICGKKNSNDSMDDDEQSVNRTSSIKSLEMRVHLDEVEEGKEEIEADEYWYIEIESL